MLFLFKMKSRRYFNDLRKEPQWEKNLAPFLGADTVPHGDTIADLLAQMIEADLEMVRTEGMRSLLRSRALESFRLLGRYYMVAFDGTQMYKFDQRHCEHCLTQTFTRKDGTKQTFYYHSVLEAKLVSPTGMAFSIATEFIENTDPSASKQDCELKAFYRLLPRLRAEFPRLSIVLLLDSLFAGAPTFALCEEYRYSYLITFKEGAIPSIESEFQALHSLTPENTKVVIQKKEGKEVHQTLRWVNQIDYEGHLLSVLEQIERPLQPTPPQPEQTRFKWLTDLKLTQNNCSTVANHGGRCRWKIENQGFNTQKHGEFELEHPYSLHRTAWKLFYLLLQITHNWEQCVLFSTLFHQLKPPQARTRRGLFERLRGIFLFVPLDWNQLWDVIRKPCQIRWDTS